MNTQIAVILSGCGVYDGAEINEVVLTLLALEQNQLTYQCFAPDMAQYDVVDHLHGRETTETRHLLTEAARIVRGKVLPLEQCMVDDYAAVVIPGGFGVVKNLCDFALQADDFSLQPAVEKVLTGFQQAGKPAGYLCIAPVMIPKIYGQGVKLTIGNDTQIIALVEQLGGHHQVAKVNEIVFDPQHNVISTPAYMLATKISEAKQGIDKLVQQLAHQVTSKP